MVLSREINGKRYQDVEELNLPPLPPGEELDLLVGEPIWDSSSETYDVPVTFSGLGSDFKSSVLTVNGKPVPVESASGQVLKSLRPGKYILVLYRDINGKRYKDIEELDLPPPPPTTIRGGAQTNSGVEMEYTRLSDADKGVLVVRIITHGKNVREIEYGGKSYIATDNVVCIPDVNRDAGNTKILIRFDNDDRLTEDFKDALK